MDKITPISKVRAHLSEIVTDIKRTHQRYIITRQGKAEAVMLSPEEMETLEILADEDLLRSLIRAEEELKGGKFYTHKEVFG